MVLVLFLSTLSVGLGVPSNPGPPRTPDDGLQMGPKHVEAW
jgi:hypothetical protein